MRRLGWSAALALAAAPLALAQQPLPTAPQVGSAARTPVGGQPTATPTAAAVLDPEVVAHLKGWEAAMKGLTTFYVKADITRTNKVLKRDVKAVAQAWCMKPNLARLDMSEVPAAGKAADPAGSMTFISTGKTLIQYDGADRTITKVELGVNGAGSHLLLDMISGLPAETAAARFDIAFKKKTDENYVYLEVKPRTKEDKSDFESMTLVLVAPTNPTRAYMPRMVVMTKPGGQDEETWSFPDPQVNPKNVTAEFFAPLKPPPGWMETTVRAPRSAPPGGSPKAPGVK